VWFGAKVASIPSIRRIAAGSRAREEKKVAMTADTACVGRCEGVVGYGAQEGRGIDSVASPSSTEKARNATIWWGRRDGFLTGAQGSQPTANDDNEWRSASSGGHQYHASKQEDYFAKTNGSWMSNDRCRKWVELSRPIQTDMIFDNDAHDAKARMRLPPLRCQEGGRKRRNSRTDGDASVVDFVTCSTNFRGQAGCSSQNTASFYLDCMEPLTGDCKMLPAKGVGRPTKAGRGPVVDDELLASASPSAPSAPPSPSPPVICSHAERPVGPIPRTRRSIPDANLASSKLGPSQGNSDGVPWYLRDDQSSFSTPTFSRLDGSSSSSSSSSSALWSRRRFRVAPLDSAGSCSTDSVDSLGLMSLCSLDTTRTGGSSSRGSSMGNMGSMGCLGFSPMSPGLAAKQSYFGASTPPSHVGAHDWCRTTSPSSSTPRHPLVKRSLILN
jgi:hypothetical protein